ncbi:TPA: hypothetical protein ACVGNR_000882 [Pseudomonas aeruginosa]
MTKANECTCPSGDGSLVHPCPAHPESVELAGGDERALQAEGAQEVPSPVSQEYDRHLISLLRKGEALPGHQEEAADEIERLRDWNDHLNNTVLPNILNPNFLMLMKGGERLLDLCTKDGKFIGVSLNDMKDVFDWMVTHARIAPDHAALAQPSPAQVKQAEAERPELWAVHAQGPDELYAAFTREDAEKHAAELNALPMPEGIAVGAVVVPSPWPEAEHWKYLAEQERDHKSEIAVRLRQFERICEGLPQDSIDGGWTVQGIRCYAKRLEDQLKVALARVAEMERKLRNEENAHTTTIEQRDNAEHWADQLANAIAERFGVDIGEHSNLNCPWNEALVWMQQPTAQAQHSVPELLVRAEGFVSGFEDDDEQEGVSQLLADLRLAIGRAK